MYIKVLDLPIHHFSICVVGLGLGLRVSSLSNNELIIEKIGKMDVSDNEFIIKKIGKMDLFDNELIIEKIGKVNLFSIIKIIQFFGPGISLEMNSMLSNHLKTSRSLCIR